MDFTWFEKNKKTTAVVGFGVLAIIALFLSFFNPVPQVTDTSYPQRIAYFSTPAELLATTVAGASLTSVGGECAMNSSNAAGGGLAYYANATSLPTAARGWAGEAEFTGAMYSAANISGTTYATFTTNSSVLPVVRLHFVLPDNGNTYTYSALAGMLQVNATKLDGHSYPGTGIANWDLGAAARVNITNATTLTSAATFVIEGYDYKNSARRETLSLSLANAGSGKGAVSTGYFKNVTSISTSNTDFAVQNFTLRTNFTNTNYTIDAVTSTFGGSSNLSPYNYTSSFDAATNFSQPARIAITTTTCDTTNATGLNITVIGLTNDSIATTEVIRDINCYAGSNVSITSHYWYQINSINVTLNTSAKQLNTSARYINTSIAVYASESPLGGTYFGYYNVTRDAANVSVAVYNWTGSAWNGINYSKVYDLQNNSLNVTSNGNYYVSGTSLYYRVSTEKNATLTIDWAHITGTYFANGTGNRTLRMNANATEGSKNCTVFGTSTSGTAQYDHFHFSGVTAVYGTKEFATVKSIACNASTNDTRVINLTNYDTSQTLATMFVVDKAFASFVANGQGDNLFPLRGNLTSNVVDLGYSDIDAGAKKFYLKCTNALTGYLEYSDDGSSWTRESATLGCSANSTQYLLSSGALAARYYKMTVNQSYDAVPTAANLTVYVQGRRSTR